MKVFFLLKTLYLFPKGLVKKADGSLKLEKLRDVFTTSSL